MSRNGEHRAPTHVGRYRVLEYLGGGGMGDVWLGEDPFGNRVAIKQLSGSRAMQQRFLQRFVREGQVLSRLQHHGICRVYGLEELGDSPCMVMEYVEGVSLGHLLRFVAAPTDGVADPTAGHTARDSDLVTIVEQAAKSADTTQPAPSAERKPGPARTLPLQQALSLVARLCDAVQYAHEHGVFHRDIKPSNVIVRRDGEPVLLDFGVARLSDERDGGERITAAGQVFGTVDYMAPEQARSGRDVDERADVYSVGAILYEMVCGRRHFPASGDTYRDIGTLQNFEPVRPRTHNRRIEPELEAIILKALSPHRERRYRSARQLGQDIQRYQAGEPITAKRPGAMYLARRMARKYRVGVVAGGVLLSALSVIGTYAAAEHYRRWGNWVCVLRSDFRADSLGISSLEFLDRSRIPSDPWVVDTGGLRVVGGQLCRLREVNVGGDVRVVIQVGWSGPRDGFEVMINATRDSLPFWYAVPRSYSCQVGGYEGTLDFVSVNKTAGMARVYHGSPSVSESEQIIEFQRSGREVELRINGRLQAHATDMMPIVGPAFCDIAFRSYSSNVVVRSLEVYRLSLPRAPDPLVVGEALNALGYHHDAVHSLSALAEDYSGRPLGERALAGAILCAHEVHDSSRQRLVDSLTGVFVLRYPASSLLQQVREREMAAWWRDGMYERVLRVLPAHVEKHPATAVTTDLFNTPTAGPVPASYQAAILEWLVRSPVVSAVDADGLGEGVLPRLAGSRVSHLRCVRSSISNLGPLRGMRLHWLVCDHNLISDLSPIANQPLRYLACSNNRLRSLDGLQGLPLEHLDARLNEIVSLDALQGGKLFLLNAASNQIRSLEPLRGMPLRDLDVTNNRIESVEPLRGSGIERLGLGENLVRELAPLSGLPLVNLTVDANPAHDFAQVMPTLEGLRSLRCSRMGITSFEPLRASRLELLIAVENKVEDLTPLVGVPLQTLHVSGNPLRSIEPLRKLPLRHLGLESCGLESLTALTGLALQTLRCGNNPLRSLEPFVDNPPEVFNFLGPEVAVSELNRVERVWAENPRTRHLAEQARLCRVLYHGNPGHLRSIAHPWNGHFYLRIAVQSSFEQADSLSRRSGGYLVSVNTSAESAFLSTLSNVAGEPFWVGLDSSAASLRWVDGTDVEYLRDYLEARPEGPWVFLGGLVSWPRPSRSEFIIEWDD